MKRDVQGSLIEGMERPTGRIPLSVIEGLNADLIAAIAPIYLTGSVLDVTYGKGMWWNRFTPDPFVFHDLHTVDGVDFTLLPHADRSFDAVCFDPPYIPQGGTKSSTPDHFRTGFGLVQRTQIELDEMVFRGLSEVSRVSRRWVLAKCMDFVNGGAFVCNHNRIINHGMEKCGLKVWDVIVHYAGTGPGGHNIYDVKRTRRANSFLIVFEVVR